MDKLFLIKDLAKLSGHSVYTIKFYLKIGLLKEQGRSPETNYRYFDEKNLKALELIRSLRKQRKSISQIKGIIDSDRPTTTKHETRNTRHEIQ